MCQMFPHHVLLPRITAPQQLPGGAMACMVTGITRGRRNQPPHIEEQYRPPRTNTPREGEPGEGELSKT